MKGVLDTSIPFGSVAMTPEALVAKQHHVNAVFAGMDNDTNFALATALKQAGVNVKAVVFPTGFESDVVGSSAWSSLQGDYFATPFRPAQLPNTGTKQLVSALQKYEGRPPSHFPTFNINESWLGADLMIKGLQLAGPNPTRAAVIKDLRNLKSYNGNGLLPQSINYSTIFGHDLPKQCGWYCRQKRRGSCRPRASLYAAMIFLGRRPHPLRSPRGTAKWSQGSATVGRGTVRPPDLPRAHFEGLESCRRE